MRWASIQEWGLKIKGFGESAIGEWGLLSIVILVGIVSFGLGRLSALEDVRPPVSILSAPTEAKPLGRYPGGLFVASRSGSVYYYPWCSGAGNIALAKQVWFENAEAAKQAGYTPSKSCKGLE